MNLDARFASKDIKLQSLFSCRSFSPFQKDIKTKFDYSDAHEYQNQVITNILIIFFELYHYNILYLICGYNVNMESK